MSENVKLVAAIAALVVCGVLDIIGAGGMKSTLDGTTSSAQSFNTENGSGRATTSRSW